MWKLYHRGTAALVAHQVSPPLLPLYENSYLMFILLPAEIFNFPAWTKQHEHL